MIDKMEKFEHNKKRYVLLLNLNNEKCHWQEKLLALNWHCIYATTLSDSIKYIKKHDINVAIVMISSNYQQSVFDTLSRLFESRCSLVCIAISCDNQFLKYPLSGQFPEYFFDYHHLPINWPKLGHILGHADGMSALKINTAKGLCKQANNVVLLGESSTIRNLRSALHKISRTDSTVLIGGETGTGKGLCAQLIHMQSNRKNGPFIKINCGALPASLIHSELFGHEKGAFTGADKLYIGHIERADKGTLLLDEIGDLTLELQIQLLQFIEDNTIERLGSNKTLNIDCRIIFASHINLEDAVEEGLFREDLYYRLNILRIHVPSLRDHREDIEQLAEEYLKLYQPAGKHFSFSASALEAMLVYEWPGNVRELKNRIQRAVVMADNEQIREMDLNIKTVAAKKPKRDLAEQHLAINAEILLAAISRNNHNISAAAKELNISRTTFYRLVKKCKIQL